MNARLRWSRVALVTIPILLAALGIAWQAGLITAGTGRLPQNAIMVIAPYRYEGTWVFDDNRFGLVREPFVAGGSFAI